MSMVYCHHCDKHVDTDYDVDHFDWKERCFEEMSIDGIVSKKRTGTTRFYDVTVRFEGEDFDILVREEWDDDGELEVLACMHDEDIRWRKWKDCCRLTDYVESVWKVDRIETNTEIRK